MRVGRELQLSMHKQTNVGDVFHIVLTAVELAHACLFLSGWEGCSMCRPFSHLALAQSCFHPLPFVDSCSYPR